MIEYILGFILLVIFIVGGVLQRSKEKREWNNGICVNSGNPWIYFDTDSQGGRGYKDGDGHTLWVSYSVDRKESR